jgi:hypothetical protein
MYLAVCLPFLIQQVICEKYLNRDQIAAALPLVKNLRPVFQSPILQGINDGC